MKTQVEILREPGAVFEEEIFLVPISNTSPKLQGIVPLLMQVWPQSCAFICDPVMSSENSLGKADLLTVAVIGMHYKGKNPFQI